MFPKSTEDEQLIKKATTVLILALAGTLILWWGFGGGGRDAQQGQGGQGFGAMFGGGGQGGAAVTVEVGEVIVTTLTNVSEYTGSLVAQHEFTLAPRAGGRIVELLVDIGDEVRQGEIIARLDDAEFVQQTQEARAALEVTQAQLADARARAAVRQREFERLEQVREQGLVSEAEFDVVRAEFAAAEANVEVAAAQVIQRQAALTAAQIRQSYATIRAEWSGGEDDTRLVGERFVNEGATVNVNEPIVTLLDKTSLRAVTYVSDRDFARLRAGQPVQVTTDVWPGELFSGQIERIAPRLDEDSRQVRVEARIPNTEGRLSPGFFVNLSIEVETVEHAVTVPLAALSRHGGRQGVYVVDEAAGVARFQPVTVGVRTREVAQIMDPPISGRVVTLGQHLLGEETPVRVVGETPRVERNGDEDERPPFITGTRSG